MINSYFDIVSALLWIKFYSMRVDIQYWWPSSLHHGSPTKINNNIKKKYMIVKKHEWTPCCLFTASFPPVGSSDMRKEARASNRGWNEQASDVTERIEKLWQVFPWGTAKLVSDHDICLVRICSRLNAPVCFFSSKKPSENGNERIKQTTCRVFGTWKSAKRQWELKFPYIPTLKVLLNNPPSPPPRGVFQTIRLVFD